MFAHALLNPAVAAKATPDATKAYADRMWQENPLLSPDSWRIAQGATVSKIGFGTLSFNGAQHEKALLSALRQGINCFESSLAYQNGVSAKHLGAALSRAFQEGFVQREELYLIGKIPLSAIALDEALDTLLTLLQVTELDCLLIQDPELLLLHETAPSPQAWQAHLQEAFTTLELAVKSGKIGCYGISSQAFSLPKEHPLALNLALLHDLSMHAAQNAWQRKKRSHFRALSLPLNLLELEALRVENTHEIERGLTQPTTALDLAVRMGMNVFLQRPLNAVYEGQMVRLASLATTSSFSALFATFSETEQAFCQALETQLLQECHGRVHFSHLKPALEAPLKEALQQRPPHDIAAFLQHLEMLLGTKEAPLIQPLVTHFTRSLPPLEAARPLQEIALNAAASIPGVTAVLNSMHSLEHVQQAVHVLEMSDFPDIAAVLSLS